MVGQLDFAGNIDEKLPLGGSKQKFSNYYRTSGHVCATVLYTYKSFTPRESEDTGAGL